MMEAQVSIFNYHDPVEWVADLYQVKRARNPNFSLRSWARGMGLSNVAHLSLVLNRKRRLLPPLARKIRNSLELGENEAHKLISHFLKFIEMKIEIPPPSTSTASERSIAKSLRL